MCCRTNCYDMDHVSAAQASPLRLHCLQIWSASSGTFVAVASMITSRMQHQMLALPPYACIGNQCVGAAGGAIVLGVSTYASLLLCYVTIATMENEEMAFSVIDASSKLFNTI